LEKINKRPCKFKAKQTKGGIDMYIMEYLNPSKPYAERIQQVIVASTMKEAKAKAHTLARLREVTEYYVRKA